MKSRAAVTVGDREIELRTLAVPDRPPRGGALLRVTANGLCGSDYDLFSGHLRAASPGLVPLPLVSGHEIVGILDKVDPEAAEKWDVRAGDRVVVDPAVRCGQCLECRATVDNRCRGLLRYSTMPLSMGSGLWGGNAEYMELLPGTLVAKVPPGLSDEDAALYNPLGNAVHWMVTVAGVRPGDSVLVLGAGQRGFACSAVAHNAGAAQVIVTGLDRDQAKAPLLSRFGATGLIHAENTVAQVRELTGGEGVDIVVDTVPGTTTSTKDGLACLKRGGRLVMAGIKAGSMADLDINAVTLRELTVRGVFGSSTFGVRRAVEMLTEARYPFAELHTHRFDLTRLPEALAILGGEVPGEHPLHLTVLP